MKKIAIIGGGTIGLSMAKAWVEQGVVGNEELLIVERNPDRQKVIATACPGVTVMDQFTEQVSDAVILSVKPQDAPAVFVAIHAKLSEKITVVSVMAGVAIKTLQKGLNHAAVIRVMPNTPLVIRQSMSVWMAAPDVSPEQKLYVQKLLQALGREQEVNEERMLDLATAVSGSGPAYLFTFLETWVRAAEALGLSRSEAETWVKQTAWGSVMLWEKQALSLDEMIARVKSKGGTTEAALSELPQDVLQKMWNEALTRADHRSQELSGEKG
jgi:pyrroline-5-carboxylate reductase